MARTSINSRLNFDFYGSRERNVIAWATPTIRNEIFLWIHGGYWQSSSIDEALVGAENLVEQGFGYAAIDYTLSPGISIKEIIDECVGAHLAMAVAARIQVDGLVLVSGVFDLRPIVQRTINDALGLTESEALALSPIVGDFRFPCAAEVLVGDHESPSF